MKQPGEREGTDQPVEAPPPENTTVAGGQFLLRAETTEFKHGDLLDDRYQIEKVIGRGATGCVLQAFDRVVRAVVAVKILRPDLAADERWVERLGGELRYARKLQHPNVCRVFDVAAAGGHHFLTMEFAGGGSLRQRLLEPAAASRSWDERTADAAAVIDGLVAIHAAHILHRDVKPENVLVMDDGRLVVSDFGLAVSMGQTTYFSSKVAGTPSYMAPEAIMGEKATKAADVFALGVVLHEIFFGRRPDWKMTEQGRVLNPAVGRKAPARERAMARLCMECLTEFAPRRPADAEAVKRHFEQAAQGRLRPWRGGLKRRWPLLVGALAVGGSLAAGALMAMRMRASRVAVEQQELAVVGGTAIDLSARSRSLLKTDKVIDCVDLLPGGKSARVVLRTKPRTAIDLDLSTGQQTAAPLRPEALASDCPRLSPDGRRLLYVNELSEKRMQIMLSPYSDGSDAEPITEGEHPSWLPSGEGFVYAFDRRRSAVFSLPKTRLLFPDTPPFEKFLQGIAINKAGSEVALLFVDNKRQSQVEVYGYPAMRLIATTKLEQRVLELQFDDRRQTLQLSMMDPQFVSLAERLSNGEIHRFGMIPETNILSSARSALGLTLLTTQMKHSMVVRRAGDGERSFPFLPAYSLPDFSEKGDALLEIWKPDGRLVIGQQLWNAPGPTLLTAGPNDGFPSYVPGKTAFTFVQRDAKSVVLCDIAQATATNCRTIVTDELGPRTAVISPDGKFIAYSTLYGPISRLRVAPITGGEPRDLGPYRRKCPPVWSSPTTLWVPNEGALAEIDVSTGRQTGQTRKADDDAYVMCDSPSNAYRKTPSNLQIRRVQEQALEIRIAADL